MMLSASHVTSAHYNLSNTVANFTSKKKNTYFRQCATTSMVMYILLLLFLSTTPAICVFVVLALLLLFIGRNEVVEESVLLIKDFGVQMKTKYASGQEEIKFLELAKVEGVIIHEFIQGSSVGFSLAFQVPESSVLLLAFKNVYPGLDFIKRVYMKCLEYEIRHR